MSSQPKASDSPTTSVPAPPAMGADQGPEPREPGQFAVDQERPANDPPPPTDGEAVTTGAQAGPESPPSRLRRWAKALAEFWDTRRTPAFLISLILHTVVFLLLALWTVARQIGVQQQFHFQASMAVQELTPQPVELLATGGDPAPPNPNPENQLQQTTTSSAATTTTLSELLQVRAPEQAANESQGELQRLLQAATIQVNASFASTGVEGRQLKRRQKQALARGGTLESEEAVERALDWLAQHQLPSGAWSLVHDQGRCNGRCRHNGSKDRFDTAATGLALLAFLGAGYTHKDGKHRETVRKGVYFLLQVMEETPQGGSFLYQSDRGMYNHGIAAFALCEAYQLTSDKDLRRPAQQAVDFIISAQNYRGGWGYLPKQPGDLTLSGWQVMALKSAFAAGLNIPPSTIVKIDAFLDSQQAESGVFYGYGKPGRSPTCTSIGGLLRMFRGMSTTDPRILDAAAYFERVGRSNGDVYFNYYVTLFMFHVGGRFWEDWNPRVREHLINTQADDGHEKGSWYFENPYGKEGGRLYTTAMCAMTLEVYYRFAPLYQQADVPFEL